MSESNYWNWVMRFTKEAIRQCKDFKPEVGDQWVADETYMKLGRRKVYFWDIIDSKTNFGILNPSISSLVKKNQRFIKIVLLPFKINVN